MPSYMAEKGIIHETGERYKKAFGLLGLSLISLAKSPFVLLDAIIHTAAIPIIWPLQALWNGIKNKEGRGKFATRAVGLATLGFLAWMLI